MLGLAAILALVIGHAWRPRWPIPLIVVALCLALMEMPGVQALTIATVGTFPQGIPWPSFPDLHWAELDTLLPLSLACFLLAYNEGIAAARLLAMRHEYSIDPNRELVGLGAANAAIAFGHGFPSAGGLSQSLVNDEGGRAHAAGTRRVLGVDGHRPALPDRPVRPPAAAAAGRAGAGVGAKHVQRRRAAPALPRQQERNS